jgi:glycosyltransferase involved in cell wall biosynthesis
MNAFDLLVVMSDEETFSLVSAEAMAAGLPVVATAVGGVAELVVDGTTGFVVPARDPARLTEAVVLLLNNPAVRPQLGAAGWRRVHERFTAGTQIPKIEAMFASMLHCRD